MSKFEWDENKNKSNKQKHGVDFEKATKVFEDENRLKIESEKNNELRVLTIGKILNLVYAVVYHVRSSVFRIISARRASKRERKDYFENLNK